MLPKTSATIALKNDFDNFYHQISDRSMKTKETFKYKYPFFFRFFFLEIFSSYLSISTLPYHGRLQEFLQRLVEQGLIEYFDRIGLRNRGIKHEEPFRQLINISSIELADFEFILIIGLIGMLISLAMFIGEVIVDRTSGLVPGF